MKGKMDSFSLVDIKLIKKRGFLQVVSRLCKVTTHTEITMFFLIVFILCIFQVY